MNNYQLENSKRKHLSLLIPSKILANPDLSLNEKFLLGIDYAFEKKLGYNSMLNTEISKLVKLHPNIISKARRRLVKIGYLHKEKTIYYLLNRAIFTQTKDKRGILLPYPIYNTSDISTGAKLLWGEYNSLSMGYRPYFAKRETTALKLDCSVESITNWTKELFENGFLKSYTVKSGFRQKQKQIITCEFSDSGKIIDWTQYEKDEFGN